MRQIRPISSSSQTISTAGGLIFDLDGTLWDSTETVTRAWNKVLRQLGDTRPAFSPADIAGIMGKTYGEIHQALFPHLNEGQWEAMALAMYAQEEKCLHREGGRLYPGVREGLQSLSGHFDLFIVSNCQSGYIESFLAWSGLGALFRDIECHGNTGATKGQNILSVISRNKPGHPVYIGDTESDHKAAGEAGVPFYLARYGFGQVTGEVTAFDSFAELTTHFLDGV